uniref:Uncharacterized protein n=1 Tax=Globisporangium ultimum (strain ATCC 200006 / CBS 805.95 / DAOM BR144) TaxID=431595 RepID=K3W4Y9_GLOUD
MTVAGYLVLNNVRAAYVEIHTGVLICTPRLRKNAAFAPPPSKADLHSCTSRASTAAAVACKSSDDPTDASRLSSSSTDSASTTMSSLDMGEHMNDSGFSRKHPRGGLPLLALRRMMMKRDATSKHSTKLNHFDEEQDDDDCSDEPAPEDEPAASAVGGRERVLQLSGHVVEVLERDEELDAPSYPFSFQVNIYTPAKRDPAGNKIGNSELVDSLILSAMDAKAKALWVKHIKHWNRYGWRDTEFINADDNDFFYMQAMMLSTEKRRRRSSAPHSGDKAPVSNTAASSVSSTGSSSTATTCGAAASGRPSRRRFYRATTAVPGIIPPS